jgi:hypothetical protein
MSRVASYVEGNASGWRRLLVKRNVFPVCLVLHKIMNVNALICFSGSYTYFIYTVVLRLILYLWLYFLNLDIDGFDWHSDQSKREFTVCASGY